MTVSPQTSLERFRRQFFQLIDPQELTWPPKLLLKASESQEWLYEHLFSQDAINYPPPRRYQLRVLKQLLKIIEESVDDPEEDVGMPDFHDNVHITATQLVYARFDNRIFPIPGQKQC